MDPELASNISEGEAKMGTKHWMRKTVWSNYKKRMNQMNRLQQIEIVHNLVSSLEVGLALMEQVEMRLKDEWHWQELQSVGFVTHPSKDMMSTCLWSYIFSTYEWCLEWLNAERWTLTTEL